MANADYINLTIGRPDWEAARGPLDGYLNRLESRLSRMEGHAGSPTFYDDLDINGHKIHNGASPLNPVATDFITKEYADATYGSGASSSATGPAAASRILNGTNGYLARFWLNTLENSSVFDDGVTTWVGTVGSSSITQRLMARRDQNQGTYVGAVNEANGSLAQAVLIAQSDQDQGNTLVGSTSQSLTTANNIPARASYVYSGINNTSGLYLQTGAGPLVFATQSAEVGRWQTTGQLIIGGTSTDIGSLGAATVLTLKTAGGFICATGPTSASYGAVGINTGATFVLQSAHSGSGTTLPISVQIDSTEVARFLTAGQLLLGGTSTDISGLGTSTVVTLKTAGGFICANATTSASYGAFGVNTGGTVVLQSAHSGSGTTLPISFQTDANEAGRITPAHNRLLWGLTSEDRGGTDPYVISKGAFICATAAANAEYVEVGNIAGSYGYIATGHTGSGTPRDLVLGTDGTEQVRIKIAGQVMVGGTSSDIGSLGAHTVLTLADANGFICASATTNASYGSFGVNAGATVTLNSSHSGGGTTLPIAIEIENTEIARFETTGRLLLNVTSSDVSGTAMVLKTAMSFVTATVNASVGSVAIVASNYFAISSGKTGSGSTLPVAIFVNPHEQALFDDTVDAVNTVMELRANGTLRRVAIHNDGTRDLLYLV